MLKIMMINDRNSDDSDDDDDEDTFARTLAIPCPRNTSGTTVCCRSTAPVAGSRTSY